MNAHSRIVHDPAQTSQVGVFGGHDLIFQDFKTQSAANSSVLSIAKEVSTIPRPERAEVEAWRIVSEQLTRIMQAPPDWNSYGALQPAAAAITRAISLLLLVASNKKPMPTVVPTVKGGVQLEWHRLGRDLEIEVTPNDTLLAFFEDEQTGEGFEGPVTLGSPRLNRLLQYATAPSR